MISVLSRQQLLSGSKIIIAICFVFAFQSCSVFESIFGPKTEPPPPPPPIEESKDDKDDDSVKPLPDVVVEDTTTIEDPIEVKDSIRIGVILPFHLNDIEQTGQYKRASENSFEIYQGLRFALADEMFKDLVVNIYVFDNEGSEEKTRQILQQKPFPQIDAVIGPLYTKNIQTVGAYANKHNIPFISPLSSSTSLSSSKNLYIFSANPTKTTRYETLFDFMQHQWKDANMSIIYQPIQKEIDVKDELLTIAAAKNQELTVKKSEGRTMFSISGEVLVKEKENVVILPVQDNDEGTLYIDRMLSYLSTLAQNYSVSVIGLEEWNSVSTIAPEKYPNINFFVLDRYFVDQNNSKKSSEVYRLQQKNNGQSLHIYALQGYDLMAYLSALIHKHGTSFANHIQKEKYEGLQLDFDFDTFSTEKQSFIENKSVNILQFKNGHWKRVN